MFLLKRDIFRYNILSNCKYPTTRGFVLRELNKRKAINDGACWLRVDTVLVL